LILEFGDALLGRNGEIVAAAGAIYRRVLARDPEFGDQMIDTGRDREVSAALPRDRLTLCRVSLLGRTSRLDRDPENGRNRRISPVAARPAKVS
jgi:hypothetical protein